MIVRDEQANLPRCLASLKGKVDRIVIVDTGSRDRTVELATEAGAEVFHFVWCDDFSAARNESLRHAAGDYILWIDADDELVERTPGALRRLCQQSEAGWGYWLDVHCPGVEPAQDTPIVRQWRLFPRSANVRFEGRIHEHPAAPRIIQPDDVLQQDEVYVVHWGYTVGGETAKRKLERNRKLIELCIRDEPHQPRHYFNLGTQLMAENEPAEALPALVEGINRW
ncbi:MAG: glycosyltransferase family 2 protein, partial [Chloroflexota bacterium]